MCRVNLPAEVHEAREERLGVDQTLDHLLPSNALVVIDVDPLVAGNEVVCDLLIAFVQEVGLSNAIGQEKEWDESEDARRQAFDEEENPPRCQRSVDLTDPVREGATVGVRESGRCDEDSVTEANLLTRIEVGQIQWHSWAVGGFCHTLDWK